MRLNINGRLTGQNRHLIRAQQPKRRGRVEREEREDEGINM